MNPKIKAQINNELKERALDASICGIAIADASHKDIPLIFINPNIHDHHRGYTKEDSLGKNCRFLQGRDTKQPELKIVRNALKNKKPCQVILKYFTKSNQLFWNELIISPFFDNQGICTHFIGIQNNITKRIETEIHLKNYQSQLESLIHERTQELENKNIALKEILSQLEIEKKSIQEHVIENIDTIIIPLIRKLSLKLKETDQRIIETFKINLNEITASFGKKITYKLYQLTPREIEICNFIKNGMTTKEIALFLSVSHSTIENQRNSIRKKL